MVECNIVVITSVITFAGGVAVDDTLFHPATNSDATIALKRLSL